MAIENERPLSGKVALVTGATRGAGRGVAIELGIAGAFVYCTGRSTRGNPVSANRPETIEETAEMVEAHGGRAIAMQVDHMVRAQVDALFERIDREQGRLDLLVNGISGMDYAWDKPYWEDDPDTLWKAVAQGSQTHLLAGCYATRRMVRQGSGLIVSISDQDAYGNLAYGLEKAIVNTLARRMAEDLGERPIAAISLIPGYMRNEGILRGHGVTEENWTEGGKDDTMWPKSHTPRYVGRAVVALASDPGVRSKSGKTLEITPLAHEYGFRDLDGRQP
jgi:NAD(P)-dependent dehydrogenase (short-subunit alcohol dehydrogenase family)